MPKIQQVPIDTSSAVQKAIDKKSTALEALTLVYGPRGEDYGPEVECFERCAAIMNEITDIVDSNVYTAKHVALMMIAIKLARRQYKYKRDNNVDLIGYADILEKLEG